MVWRDINDWFWRHPMLLYATGMVLAIPAGFILLFVPATLMHKLIVAAVCVAGLLMAGEGSLRSTYLWVCSKCGNWEVVRYKFCPRCGGKMIPKPKEEPRCPRGHTVPKYAKYCPKCGEKIEEGDG
jgi:ribosomal protein S27AE